MKELPRVLRFWDGLALCVGAVIGSGIFLTAPHLCAKFTTAGPALLLWIVGAGLALLGALTFAELATTWPRTGGMYVYLLEAYGRPTAFVYGWAALIVGPASMGALSIGFSNFAIQFYGLDGDPRWVAAGSLTFLTALNIAGTLRSSRIIKILTVIKVLALVMLIGAGCLWFDRGNISNFGRLGVFESASDQSVWAVMGLSLFAVAWTYGGWDAVTIVAGEVREPQKMLPRIMLVTILIVAAIYFSINFIYIHVLGIDQIAASKNVAGETGTALFGPAFGALITFSILCSILGTLNGSVMTGARGPFAMARSGLLFGAIGRLHPRLETPMAALLIRWACAVGFIFAWPEFFTLLTYAAISGTVFSCLAVGSLFIFRARGLPSTFRVPGYPFVPLAYLLLKAAMIANALAFNTIPCLIVLGMLVAGFPIYAAWAWLKRPVPELVSASDLLSREAPRPE
jgi:APA family basic amino acid/polyamine antiporter